jgi:5'-methylthioadenosine phosphorylase
VTVEAVLEVMRHNIETSKAMIRQAVGMLPEERGCVCGGSLKNTIMTPAKLIPARTRKDLAPIIGKYLKK